MTDNIKSFLARKKINCFSFIPLSKCRITKQYLLDRVGISDGTVIVLAIPYYSGEFKDRNISYYAIPRDYHLYFSMLEQEIQKELHASFPKNKFFVFADHSPVDERHAAAISGLGVVGKNGLLITPNYSSYVFIGEIITDATLECPPTLSAPVSCEGCNKCVEACPFHMADGKCLSMITQKKGELDEEDRAHIKSLGCAWGCDICQEVCPHTISAKKRGSILSSIDFFNNELIYKLDLQAIDSMSDDEFAQRAYSWRKKETIKRNLNILGYEE